MSEAEKRSLVDGLIRRIVEQCPRRQAGSASELRGQRILEAELQGCGLQTQLLPFRYNTSLYAVLTLHGAFGVAGTALLLAGLPVIAFVLHLVGGISFWADLSRRGHLLRRLLPFRQSHNLLGTMPAAGQPQLRVVIAGHMDAAFTGLLFHPTMVRMFGSSSYPRPLHWLNKMMVLPVGALFLLAAVDAVILALPQVLSPLVVTLAASVLTIPLLLAVILNGEIVLRNQLVPGANDNLTACAAVVALARRLAPWKPQDVELVFASTGAEEAGTGGALALARGEGVSWDQRNTVILGLDGLTNGTLRYFREGELKVIPIASWLEGAVEATIGSDPRFAEVERFDIPAGATDVLPFLAHGYDGVSLGCVDPAIGAPRHYHRLSDTPDNLDLDQLMMSIDFAEALVRQIIAAKDNTEAGAR